MRQYFRDGNVKGEAFSGTGKKGAWSSRPCRRRAWLVIDELVTRVYLTGETPVLLSLMPRQPREMGHAGGCPSRGNDCAAARERGEAALSLFVDFTMSLVS